MGSLNNRWYNGLPIHAELSPVTDFREACCRQYEMGCGYVHAHTHTDTHTHTHTHLCASFLVHATYCFHAVSAQEEVSATSCTSNPSPETSSEWYHSLTYYLLAPSTSYHTHKPSLAHLHTHSRYLYPRKNYHRKFSRSRSRSPGPGPGRRYSTLHTVHAHYILSACVTSLDSRSRSPRRRR